MAPVTRKQVNDAAAKARRDAGPVVEIVRREVIAVLHEDPDNDEHPVVTIMRRAADYLAECDGQEVNLFWTLPSGERYAIAVLPAGHAVMPGDPEWEDTP